MAPDARLSGQAISFSTFSNILDSRLLRALADMGFSRPTSIQACTIPLALDEHRDILARARTGSGKTAAYCIPVVQKILLSKGKGKDKGVVSCVHLESHGGDLIVLVDLGWCRHRRRGPHKRTDSCSYKRTCRASNVFLTKFCSLLRERCNRDQCYDYSFTTVRTSIKCCYRNV